MGGSASLGASTIASDDGACLGSGGCSSLTGYEERCPFTLVSGEFRAFRRLFCDDWLRSIVRCCFSPLIFCDQRATPASTMQAMAHAKRTFSAVVDPPKLDHAHEEDGVDDISSTNSLEEESEATRQKESHRPTIPRGKFIMIGSTWNQKNPYFML